MPTPPADSNTPTRTRAGNRIAAASRREEMCCGASVRAANRSSGFSSRRLRNNLLLQAGASLWRPPGFFFAWAEDVLFQFNEQKHENRPDTHRHGELNHR